MDRSYVVATASTHCQPCARLSLVSSNLDGAFARAGESDGGICGRGGSGYGAMMGW